MKNNLCESLSVLMDNEGDEFELRRVLKALDDSPDAAETWRRYHLARSLMHREHDIDVSVDLSAGVMSRIEAEPAPRIETPSTDGARHGSLSITGGAAVAAAVSLMVITGVQFYNRDSGTVAPQVASDSSSLTNTSGAQPASVMSEPPSTGERGANVPFLQPPSVASGLMPVGIENELPMFMAPNQRQSQRADMEQARLLKTYLERHSQGAAYGTGEVWMPLLRAPTQEPLSQR